MYGQCLVRGTRKEGEWVWTESGRPMRLDLSLRDSYDLDVNREEEMMLESAPDQSMKERKW